MLQSPRYKKIVREQARPDAQPLTDQFASLPFSRTHINTFKKIVDSINAEKFTIDQMAKKFTVPGSNAPEWESESIWDESSDLSILLKWYLPDS